MILLHLEHALSITLGPIWVGMTFPAAISMAHVKDALWMGGP